MMAHFQSKVGGETATEMEEIVMCVCVCVHNISMREHSWQFDLCIITERAPLSVLS